MTASPWPRPQSVPTNAVTLADLMYVETCTPETWIALVSELGYAAAFAVWFDAAALLEQRAPQTRYGPALTLDAVDHDPVPGQPATVCGHALTAVPAPSDLNPPQGQPCPDCFGARK